MKYITIFLVSILSFACGEPEIRFIHTQDDQDILFNGDVSNVTDVTNIDATTLVSTAVNEFGALVVNDNVTCSEISDANIAKACQLSNESYKRILGFTDFHSEQLLVFVPTENWEAFLVDAGMEGRKIGGFCSISMSWHNGVIYGNNMYIRASDDWKRMTDTISHERAHCTLGAIGHEVVSMLLGFHLTLDQALLANDVDWAVSLKNSYFYSGTSYKHTVGKYLLWKYLEKFEDENNSYETLIQDYQTTIANWSFMDWEEEDMPGPGEGAMYTHMDQFLREYLEMYSDVLYGENPCTDEQIQNQECALQFFVPMNVYKPYTTLPSRSIDIRYFGDITRPTATYLSRGTQGYEFQYRSSMSYITDNWFEENAWGTNEVGTSNYFVSIHEDLDQTLRAFAPGEITGVIEVKTYYYFNDVYYEFAYAITGGDICSTYTFSDYNYTTPGFWVDVYSDATTQEVTIGDCR